MIQDKKLVQSIRICHLGGAGRFEYVVTSLPDGSDNWHIKVRGKRPTEISEVQGEELVEFANCRDEIEAVKRYINKYGPPFLIEREGEEFLYADTLGRWKSMLRTFRMCWDRMLGLEIKDTFTETFGKEFPELWQAQEPWIKAQAEGEFQISDHGLIFLAKTHYMALTIKLLAIAASRKLRKCLNPNCSYTPYFIATHGKIQYCSEECGQWGQRQAKLKYWHENKQEKQQKPKPTTLRTKGGAQNKPGRGRKDGTQKAR